MKFGESMCNINNKYKTINRYGPYIEEHLKEGYYFFQSNEKDEMGKYGVISENGDIIIPENKYYDMDFENDYDYIICYYSRILDGKRIDDCYIYNYDGTKLNEEPYSYIKVLNKNYIFCKCDLKYFIINEKGKVIIEDKNIHLSELISDSIDYIIINNILFIKNDKGLYGGYNHLGEKILDYIYEEIYSGFNIGNNITSQLFPVKKNGMWGYIDNNFQEIISFQYYEAGIFSDGYAGVRDYNKNYNYIDINGNSVFDVNKIKDNYVQNIELGTFNNGLAKIYFSYKSGYDYYKKIIFIDTEFNIYDSVDKYRKEDSYLLDIKYEKLNSQVIFKITTRQRYKKLFDFTYENRISLDDEFYPSNSEVIVYENGQLISKKTS